MKYKGYSLIELLISAAIFAGVLTLSFSVFATVNRLSRNSDVFRTSTFNAFSLASTIADFTRYATPVRTSTDSLACKGYTESTGTTAQLAGKYGVTTTADGLTVAMNIQSGIGAVASQQVFSFTLTPKADQPTQVIKTITYHVYQPTLTVYRLSNLATCQYELDSTMSTSDLIPANLVVIVPPANPPFSVESAGSMIDDSIGELTLNQEQIDETLARLVHLHLMIVNSTDLSANPDTAKVFAFQTAISPRTYVATFAQP